MNYKAVIAALIAAAPTYVLSHENPHYDEHAFEQVLNKYKNLYTLENIHAIIQELDLYVADGTLPQESVGWLGLLLLTAHAPSRSAQDKSLYENILECCYQHGFDQYRGRKFTPDKIATAIAISNDTTAVEQLNKQLLLVQDEETATQKDIVKVHTNLLASYNLDKARQETRRIITVWKNNHYSPLMLNALFSVLHDPFMCLLSIVDQRDSGPGLNTKEQQVVDFLKEALPGPTRGWLYSDDTQKNNVHSEPSNEAFQESEHDRELIKAICNGSKAGVQTALSKGANPEATNSGDCICGRFHQPKCYCQELSALSVSVRYGADIEIMELLLQAGACPAIVIPCNASIDSKKSKQINELLDKYGKLIKPEPMQHYPWTIFSALLYTSGDWTDLSDIIVEDHICDETCGITTCCPKSCCK